MFCLIVAFASCLNGTTVPTPPAQVNAALNQVADTNTVDVHRDRMDSTLVDAGELISYAQKFKGVRYKYASADPDKGFDCSGFVLYVFKHFHVNVPRSSSAFSKIGRKVSLDEAQPGDIILFTGPKSGNTRTVGHVGIVTTAGNTISFIHATSGKAYSVIETPMSEHYKKRFVKVVRVL